MAQKRSFGLTAFHLFGLLLAGFTTLISYYCGQGISAFLYLGIYAVFFLLSLAQRNLMREPNSMRVVIFLYNFFLGIKTLAIFSAFFVYGSFGNIHSDESTEVLLSVFLFSLILFAIVNVFVEGVHLNKIVRAYEDEEIVFNTLLPKSVAAWAGNFPLFYQGVMLATLVLYILQMGFSSFWLVITFAVYGIFVTFAYCALAGKRKMGSFIGYALFAAIKNIFVWVMLSTSGNGGDMVDTRALYPIYVGLLWVVKILLIVSVVVDIIILVRLLFGKRQEQTR